MNKEEIERIKDLKDIFNKKLENYELDKKFGQLSIDSIYSLFPNEIKLLLDYINQLETNRDETIKLIKFEWEKILKNENYSNHLWSVDGLVIKKIISSLERGKE